MMKKLILGKRFSLFITSFSEKNSNNIHGNQNDCIWELFIHHIQGFGWFQKNILIY